MGIHKVLETARILYGLIHARYVLTAQGLTDMKAKYKAHEFGSCPRTLCEKQTVLPTGGSDTASLSGENPMKLCAARFRFQGPQGGRATNTSQRKGRVAQTAEERARLRLGFDVNTRSVFILRVVGLRLMCCYRTVLSRDR